jgi:CO dehydrogenase/acetyl-CoA synthase epsilon subunit
MKTEVTFTQSTKEDKLKRKINFNRDGLTLVGNLFAPEGFDENGHYKAVIVEGSFTSVKEQMPDTYAAKFAEQASSPSPSTTATTARAPGSLGNSSRPLRS